MSDFSPEQEEAVRIRRSAGVEPKSTAETCTHRQVLRARSPEFTRERATKPEHYSDLWVCEACGVEFTPTHVAIKHAQDNVARLESVYSKAQEMTENMFIRIIRNLQEEKP